MPALPRLLLVVVVTFSPGEIGSSVNAQSREWWVNCF